LAEKKREEEEARKAKEEAAKKAAKQNNEIEKLEQEKVAASQPPVGPTKKKAKRTDAALLDTATPCEKCEFEGNTWKLPMHVENNHLVVYSEPRNAWREFSIKKLWLIFLMGHVMAKNELLEHPVTFTAVMEFIGADAISMTFQECVFAHLIALILINDTGDFNEAIQILLDLSSFNLLTPATIAAVNVAELMDIIVKVNSGCELGSGIFDIANELVKPEYGRNVPTTKEELLEIGLDDHLASSLMQQVFGSTELVVGLNACKLMVALDLMDWEECGARAKQDVKMVSITSNSVVRSLATWLPKGDGVLFQDYVESFASAVGANAVGFWGKYKKLAGHFNPKDKQLLLEMVQISCNSTRQPGVEATNTAAVLKSFSSCFFHY
jgi:hypothetical protein